ncbi:unnamed protein product, partial [Gulo gulo]
GEAWGPRRPRAATRLPGHDHHPLAASHLTLLKASCHSPGNKRDSWAPRRSPSCPVGWIRTQGHTCPGQRPWEQSSRHRPLPLKEIPPHTSLRAKNFLLFLLKSLQDVSCPDDKDAGKQITTYRDDERHSSLS